MTNNKRVFVYRTSPVTSFVIHHYFSTSPTSKSILTILGILVKMNYILGIIISDLNLVFISLEMTIIVPRVR